MILYFHIFNSSLVDLHPNMSFVWTCEHNSKGGSYTMLLVYYHLIRTLQDFLGQTSVEDLHSCSFRKRVNLKQPSEYYLREWQLQPLILPCSTFLQGSLSPPVRLAFGKVSGKWLVLSWKSHASTGASLIPYRDISAEVFRWSLRMSPLEFKINKINSKHLFDWDWTRRKKIKIRKIKNFETCRGQTRHRMFECPPYVLLWR